MYVREPQNMRYLVVTTLINVIMMTNLTRGQYPDCVPCPNGSPLSPLSYNTMRSHVFNGTQPSNERCILIGEVTTECGQGTTLIDCDRGYNDNDNVDYSEISNYFIWNRTASVDQQVSIVFRFDQQINISRISMFFWNSQSNNIIVPNVTMYWSNDDSITPSNVIDIIPGSPNTNGDRRSRLNIGVNDDSELKFRYLRITMTFVSNSEWIFLSEVQLCGNAPPFHIIQPSTDNDVQIVSPTATMATLTCSLNVTIPSSMVVSWLHNDSTVTADDRVAQAGNTTTLLIRNPQSSDAGVYHCAFNDTTDTGWILRRSVEVIIKALEVIQPPDNVYTVNFDELTDSVQLMCSLNIDIPSSVTVTWTYNSNRVITNGVSTAGNTTTLVIGNPQPSDAGAYQCTFKELKLQRLIELVFQNTSTESMVSFGVTSTAMQTSTVLTSSAVMHQTTSSLSKSTYSTMTLITSSSISINFLPSTSTYISPGSNGTVSDDDGSNVGMIVAPIVIIFVVVVIVVAVLITGFFVQKKRKQRKHSIAHDNKSSVTDTKLKSLTIYSNISTLNNHFGGAMDSDIGTQSNGNVYAVPNQVDKRESESAAESKLSYQSNSPSIPPDCTSGYDEVMKNPFHEQPNAIVETSIDSIDDEVMDDRYDKDEGMAAFHDTKKVSSHKGKSKSLSKMTKKKPTKSSSSSTKLRPLKALSAHSSGMLGVNVEGDKTLKGFQSSLQLNPLYASSQLFSKVDKNVELNIYDSIQSPVHKDTQFTESIYSEIIEPNTLITTENPQGGSVKDDKDLYPYSSIYAEPLPLDKSESPPLVTAQNLSETKLLGTGQFGEVTLANTVGLSELYLHLGKSEDSSISIKVAVKKLKLNSTKETQQAFEREIKFMSRLKDDNVIRLLGICTTGTPFIMMEYMENGDLNQYLQQFELVLQCDETVTSVKAITPVILVYMAYQIASGMKYLSSLKYVHRDLATRNVLVGKDYIVKIADFGMSQNLYSAYYFKVKGLAVLPIRWMAYECFFGKFSVKTDVWAFGITLWEIFTLAKERPYHDMGDQEVIESALKGENRLLMNKPENCPDEIYEAMLRCWVHDPTKRATFIELYDALKAIQINNGQ